MRLSKVAVLALIVGTAGSMSASPSPALAASDCPKLVELADWGQNSTGDISVAAGESCLFPITMRGTVTSSEIFQKPAHGKLKKLNATTYEYKAKARYKGSDTFAIKATGQGPTTSGTSVITVTRDDQIALSRPLHGRTALFDKLSYSSDPLRPLTPVFGATRSPFSGVADGRTSLCSDAVITRKTIAPSRSSMSRISPTRAGVSCRSDKRIITAPMRITANPVQHKRR